MYTNSLLATLNARKLLRGVGSQSADTMSLSLREFPNKGSIGQVSYIHLLLCPYGLFFYELSSDKIFQSKLIPPPKNTLSTPRNKESPRLVFFCDNRVLTYFSPYIQSPRTAVLPYNNEHNEDENTDEENTKRGMYP